MRRSSGAAPDARPSPAPAGTRATRLRTVRADGTPVYRYDPRPGTPPITVLRFDADIHGDAPPGHRHAHDFLVLVYVEEGGGAVRLGDARRDLRDGDLVAVGPGQVLASDSPITHARAWSVYFMPDAVPALAEVSPLAWDRHPLTAPFAGRDGGGAVAPPSDRERWSAWFAELADETAAPDRIGAAAAATSLLTRMLVELARLAAAPGARGGVADPLVARVFDVVEARFREPVTPRDVAHDLGYTTGHLSTVVRERTGRTLQEWLTERRMTEARRLLAETDLPLAAVAHRTGHRDAGYLARRFRERFGVTPIRWRRETRRSAAASVSVRQDSAPES
jgi:AraC-like DNA-binding protein